MIFAADLDRTLIFSARTLSPCGKTIPVESRMGEPAGFMTAEALETLRRIQKKAIVFINTLRGLEQARRVDFVADGSCPYLSLQNGLYLYQNGVEDTVWSKHVRRTVSALPLDLAGGIHQVLAGLPGIECLSKQYEYLAVFFVDEAAFDEGHCTALAQTLAKQGWSLVRQRKKLYLSPLELHKGAVLDRVRTLAGEKEAIGFGDSGFDLPMLQACQRAYALRNCELDGKDWGFPLYFSVAPGQMGSEEVLRDILCTL